MDISVFRAICRELSLALPGARLVEVTEGGAGELCLTLRKPGGKAELLICPRPDMPRIHLCAGRACRNRTLTPSMQSIANRIIGATVGSVLQQDLERAVSFRLERKTRQGPERATLVFEMAGKKPNLIVLDGEGRVAAAQTYVPLSDEAVRPVLPGLAYEPPPLPDKLDPLAVTADDIAGILGKNYDIPPDKALFKSIGGISPLIAREAAILAGEGAGPPAVKQALEGLIERVLDGPYEPCIISTERGPVLAAFGLAQYAGRPADYYDSMSLAAETYYSLIAQEKLFEDEKRSLRKQTLRKADSARKRLGALEGDMARSENAETFTRYGNLIMAQLSSVPSGANEVSLKDLFLEDGAAVTIPLDPRLSPVKNAERYFGLARKAVTGAKMVRERLKAAQDELRGLEARIALIDRAINMDELYRAAGRAERPIKGGRPAGSPGKQPQYPSFTSSDGFEVLYAKNAKANDTLTFKLAEPMDLWLHAQGYHGAHVIVRNPGRQPDIPLSTILEAAACAAYFSDARKDSSVPVDYTFRKYVRKPRDPVPGQAVFTQNKTVFVDPKKP